MQFPRTTVRSAVVALFATFALAGGPLGARAAAVQQPSPLDRVQAWLDGAKTLSGEFEQTLVSGALGGDVVESGRLWIRRPGSMRWDYEIPERKVAVVRDGATLLYLEVERQAIEGTLDQGGGVLLALLAGDRPLSELFDEAPERDDDPAAPRDGAVVRLRPLEADGTFESVALVVRRKTGAILSARVRDAAGNVMDYAFPDLLRNVDLPPATFEFRVPDGTEMLTGH